MARYVIGDRFAVVVPGAAGLFAPGIAPATLESIADAMRRGRGLGGVVEVLFGAHSGSLADLPDFALVFADGDHARVAVRGVLTVRVDRAEADPVEIDGGSAASWAEQLVSGATSARLGAPTDAATLPLHDGIAPAGGVSVTVGHHAPTGLAPESAPESESESESAQAAAGAFAPVAAPVLPAEEEVVEDVAHLAVAQAADLRADLAADETRTGETTVDELLPEAGAASEAASAGASAPAIDAEPANRDDEYDELLFGETRMSTIEDAAVRTDPDAGDLIAGLPAFASAERPTADPAPAAPGTFDVDEGDHDGETISAEELRAMHGEEEPIPGVVAASALASSTLVLSTGERFTLDRGAVIGRRPRLNRVLGGQAPHLVAVPSPNQDVSRAHLEIRVEGSHVLAVDLDTTNGSRLQRQGQEPRRLHPGEVTLLVAGDRIDIGDGNVLSFEGLA